jgi:hypothetical protein
MSTRRCPALYFGKSDTGWGIWVFRGNWERDLESFTDILSQEFDVATRKNFSLLCGCVCAGDWSQSFTCAKLVLYHWSASLTLQNFTFWPDVVVHIYNPSYSRSRCRRITVGIWPWGRRERGMQASYLKKKVKAKSWECGSGSRVLA